MRSRTTWTLLGSIFLAACTIEPLPETGVDPTADEDLPAAISGLTVETDYADQAGVTVFRIPVGNCPDNKSTPIIVGNYLLIPMGENGALMNAECADQRGSYEHSVLGLEIGTNNVYEMFYGGRSEGGLLYDAASESIFWPQMSNTALMTLNATDWSTVGSLTSLDAGNDSHGTYHENNFYFGTINTPEESCNSSRPNADCGVIVSVDADGVLQNKLDLDQGFRAWITGGPVSDGEHLFVGTGTDCYGSECGSETEHTYRYGCSALMLDSSLNIVNSYDPGDPGCTSSGNLEDAVVGEMALGPNAAWAQMGGMSTDSGEAYIIQFNRDLNVQCKVTLESNADSRVGGFYQAPTVDKNGNAFVAANLPSASGGGRDGHLLKINPCSSGCGESTVCRTEELKVIEDQTLNASPTLVDDAYVLLAQAGKLSIVTTSGESVKDYDLGSQANVLNAPVIHDGVIYILSNDGVLTRIENSGLSGYGNAHWPRMAHDNAGTATAD